LFERLEEQKQKRELEYEEAHRLSKLPVNTKLSTVLPPPPYPLIHNPQFTMARKKNGKLKK
jgi:hypothetical protein